MNRYKVTINGTVYLDKEGDLCIWEDVKQIKKELKEYKKKMPLGADGIGIHGVDPKDCPTFYDGCHCTAETLFSIIVDRNKMIEDLEAWLKYAENYDPYGPNSVGRYGSAASGIEKEVLIERLKEILGIKEKEE